MRIRQIKPEFWKDPDLGEVSPLARLLFIGLWCLSSQGIFENDSRLIKAEIFPFDSNIKIDNIEKLIQELTPKFITLYTNNNKKYCEIINFKKHQKLMGNESNNQCKYPSLLNENSQVTFSNQNGYPVTFSNSHTDKRITDNGYTDNGENLSFLGKTPKTLPPSKKHKFTEEQMEVAIDYYDIVLDKFPFTKKPKLDEWANTIRLLNETDGYTMEQIIDVASWALKDEFWSKNARSPTGLRRNIESILAQSDLFQKWEKEKCQS